MYPDLQYGRKNGEKRIGPHLLKVDGYSRLADTAFEFDGCYYHGCTYSEYSDKKSTAETSAFKKLMSERRASTAAKHAYLRDNCRLVVIKECAFRPTFSLPHERILLTNYLLKQICDGKYFGTVVCDIRVPEHLREHFAEMTPVFKNVDVSLNDVGTYMQNICEHPGKFKTP